MQIQLDFRLLYYFYINKKYYTVHINHLFKILESMQQAFRQAFSYSCIHSFYVTIFINFDFLRINLDKTIKKIEFM